MKIMITPGQTFKVKTGDEDLQTIEVIGELAGKIYGRINKNKDLVEIDGFFLGFSTPTHEDVEYDDDYRCGR